MIDPDTAKMRDNLASFDLILLLDYLRGPIVKKIKLTSGLNQDLDLPLDNSAVLGVLLQAIAENPNPLEIDCELYVPPSTLAQFVRDARKSLVRFHLNIESCVYYDTDEYDRPQEGKEDRINVANAFKDNDSLEYLRLYNICRFSDIDHDPRDVKMDLVERVLVQLFSHPSLETLVLSADASDASRGKVPMPRTLPALVQDEGSTCFLGRIQIEGFNLPPADLTALTTAKNRCVEPIAALDIDDCTFFDWS